MDFTFTPEQQRFRQEIRGFLNKELTPAFKAALESSGSEGFSPEFSRKLGQKGWIGLPWPREYGGQELGYIERLIYDEEMTLAGAPVGYHNFAERQMGPSLVTFGTQEQKGLFLPKITRGEASFAIGYSEPGVGSDLASLQTRAVADGDDYIVNGSKIWTSFAHRSDYIWLATRTNPDAPKHRGISVFIVDMKSPGVTIRPIYNLADQHVFNQIFFDNVRVPKSRLVGELNMGWYAVANNLDFERASMDRVASAYPVFQGFLAFCREARANGRRLGEDVRVRHRLAQMTIEFEVGRMLCYRVAWMLSRGKVPNQEASMAKLFGSEYIQRTAQGCMEILGPYGQLAPGSKWAPLKGRIERLYLSSVALTIAGGSSEILRNVIAQRGLGLPR